MKSSIVKHYSITYTIAASALLLMVPSGAYVILSYYGMLKMWPLFQSVTGWCTVAVIVWLLGLLFMRRAVKLSTKIDQSFAAQGFTINQRIINVWNLTLIPAILGCLLAIYTFLELHHPLEAFNMVQLFILIIGFVPVTLYGLARARQATKILMGQELMNAQNTSADYKLLKWWPFMVIIFTFLLTPFFGAAIAANQLRRLVPRYRVLISVVTVLSGLLITWIIKPLAKTLKEFRQEDPVFYQALALYATLALFTGVAYVLVIKFAAHFQKKPEGVGDPSVRQGGER